MNTNILTRSYDLRAIYPSEITEKDFFLIGQAIGSWAPGGVIYIGGDARLSTPSLKESIIEGLMHAGKHVVDLGVISSDMLQFSTLHYPDAAVGIMITASHNPKEYNGFKMCLRNAVPINLKSVGPELLHIMESSTLIEAPEQGKCEKKDILPAWIDFLASHAQSDLSKIKVVADAGNGTAGIFMQALADRLGFELIPLFFEPDGNFPNHHPSPIETKNLQDLVKKVREVGADIGVAFDGDADRAVMCDENGEIISSSQVLAAVSELLLTDKPGKKIIYNTTCGHIAKDTIEACGGIALREKVGNVYIKERMQTDPDIIFAGEHSSHFYFQDLWNADSGILAFLIILDYLEQYELKASEMRKKFGKYASLEETNFRVTNVGDVLNRLSEAFSDAHQDRFDGLTATYPDKWFNVRWSSNEPVIRLNAEANSPDELNHLTERVIAEIGPFCV